MSKETFKLFLKKNPEIRKEIINSNITVQKLYELYDLYDDEDLLIKEIGNNKNKINNSINDIVDTIKNIDLNKLQTGIESIQNTITLIQNFNKKEDNTYIPKYEYKPMDD